MTHNFGVLNDDIIFAPTERIDYEDMRESYQANSRE